MEQNEKDGFNQSEENILDNNDQKEEQSSVSSSEDNIAPAVDLEAKVAELNDKYLRLYSEFDNYRKRTIKEKSDIIRSAGEDVFKAVIPTIDDFERAIKANESVTEAAPIKEGMVLIYNKLKASCISKGLEAMESTGKPFDADIMEAITHIPSPSEDMKGKVIDEIEKGYKLGDKVIRFAKVVVGN
jgi:molecular chaperone GrpE